MPHHEIPGCIMLGAMPTQCCFARVKTELLNVYRGSCLSSLYGSYTRPWATETKKVSELSKARRISRLKAFFTGPIKLCEFPCGILFKNFLNFIFLNMHASVNYAGFH